MYNCIPVKQTHWKDSCVLKVKCSLSKCFSKLKKVVGFQRYSFEICYLNPWQFNSSLKGVCTSRPFQVVGTWCTGQMQPTNYFNLALKGVLHLWALFLKTLCIFSKNKATSDKVSYGSGQKCSKELENYSFTSVETIVVKLQ